MPGGIVPGLSTRDGRENNGGLDSGVPWILQHRLFLNRGPKPGLVNIRKTMERSTIFNGKIHYFDWAIFNSYVKLPEGKSWGSKISMLNPSPDPFQNCPLSYDYPLSIPFDPCETILGGSSNKLSRLLHPNFFSGNPPD